ncbi:Hypothetical predicted protein [Paramuricea clavata]|uniref:Uncharacterized protein n=1 Tax=Paramuricea clavata TaxID=317549 RepID=A0A6S7GKG5_PARCT|nr:Hypothetical predicted protein [Paramuricea clavata]
MCGVEGCQRRHHPLLHSSEKEVKPPQADPGAESSLAPENNRSTQDMQSGGYNVSGVGATNSSSRSYRIGLQVVPVRYGMDLSLFLAICRECRGKRDKKMRKEGEWVRLKADTESVNDITDK